MLPNSSQLLVLVKDQARQHPTTKEGGSPEIPLRQGQPVFFKGTGSGRLPMIQKMAQHP